MLSEEEFPGSRQAMDSRIFFFDDLFDSQVGSSVGHGAHGAKMRNESNGHQFHELSVGKRGVDWAM